MKTMNISITKDQARFVETAAKRLGFANRSEFMRAFLRFLKANPKLVKQAVTAPFVEDQKARPLKFEQIRKKAIPILKKHDVEFAGIFGSYARGEDKPGSDIDILYRYKTAKSLLDTVRLTRVLSDALDCNVDLVSEAVVHPYIRPQVKKDLKVLYGKRQYI